MKRAERARKVVDETTQVRCALGEGIIREEVWQDRDGVVVKYNLAFINPSLCPRDNGRVLGYDNSHGHHHRHYAGVQETAFFSSYEALVQRFLDEVQRLRSRKDPL